MPIRELDPEDAVNRDVEQEEFTNLLQFIPGEDARLLIIRDDKPDSGKTTLLRRLHYNCARKKPSKPVCLIPLTENDNEKITSELQLLKKIVNALSKPDFDTFAPLKFPTFEASENSRVKHIFAEFRPPAATHSGTVQAEGAQLGPNSVVGGIVMTNPYQVTVNAAGGWGPEQEDLARQESVKAFFTDLKVIADQEPVVILIDSFDERSEEDVRNWILNNLVQFCFDLAYRPQQFVLVLAGRGRELPNFSQNPTFQHLVKSRDSLRDWTKDHVRAILKVHRYDELTDEVFDLIWTQVQSGEPIGRVLKLVDLYKHWKSGKYAA